MKKFLLASTAVLLAAPALAADLPRRTAAVAPAPAPVFVVNNWSGFYVGAQVGYAWTGADTVLFGAPGQRFNQVTYGLELDGVVGGLHAGVNFQSGSWVYGVEADIELADVNTRFAILGINGSTKNDLRGSLRARVGYSFDRALLYVTGGLAAGQFEHSLALNPRSTGDDMKFGWTVGAGIEYALTSNWSARLEYRYTDFGNYRTNAGLALGATGSSVSELTDHAVRVGVSYRFGGASRPVVARY